MDSLPGYTKESKLFCAPDADISFLSSDGVLFKLHSTHINTNSEVLATHDDTFIGIDSDAAPLPERSDVLEILFQFIEPPPESRNYRQPSVLDMKPYLFFAVAEAAEKYIVYGAMNTFMTQMPRMTFRHAFEVLNHCAKHAYFEVADDAAASTLDSVNALDEAVSKLTAPGVLPRWLIYYDAWFKAATKASEIYENNLSQNSACHIMAHLYAKYLRRIIGFPATLTYIRQEVENEVPCGIVECPCRFLNSGNGTVGKYPPWHAELEALKAGVPKFSLITL